MTPVAIKIKLDLWRETHLLCNKRIEDDPWHEVKDMMVPLENMMHFRMRFPEMMNAEYKKSELDVMHLMWPGKLWSTVILSESPITWPNMASSR